MWNRGIAPFFLNLGSRRKSVIVYCILSWNYVMVFHTRWRIIFLSYIKSRLSVEKYCTGIWERKTGEVNQQEVEGSKEMRVKKEAALMDIPTLSTLFFFSWVGFLPCRLLQNVGIHLPASHCHMIIIFIVTTMRPSNLANKFLYLVIFQCAFEV